MKRDLYMELATQLIYGKRLDNDDELDIPTQSYFDWKFKNYPEQALKELGAAAYELAVLDISSKSAWDDYYQAKSNGASEKELGFILEDAYNASKEVNKYWKNLQRIGMAEYMPEQY